MGYKQTHVVLLTCIITIAIGLLFNYFYHTPFDLHYMLSAMYFEDDAFYYFKVVSNILSGNVITFDSINVTNGFQPLWLILLLPIRYFSSNNVSFLYAVMSIQFVFLSLAYIYMSFAVLNLTREKNALLNILALIAVVLLFIYPEFIRINTKGLETSLYICIGSITLWWLSRSEYKSNNNPKRLLGLGCLIALINLSRTDSLLLTLILTIYFLIDFKRKGNLLTKENIISFFFFCLPLVLFVLPYIVYNYFYFDNITPVSGAVKMYYSFNALQSQSLVTHTPKAILLLKNMLWPIQTQQTHILIIVLLNISIIPFYLSIKRPYLAMFSLFIIAKFIVYSLLFYRHSGYSWYYAIDYLSIPIILSVILSICNIPKIEEKQKYSYVAYTVIILLTSVMIGFSASKIKTYKNTILHHQKINAKVIGNELAYFYACASLLNDAKLPSSLFFGMNNCGVFGYFLEGKVINFDGLINGKKRLLYIKKFGYDFTQYMDDIAPIDAYIDFIHYNAKERYDEIFLKRGFVFIDIESAIINKGFRIVESLTNIGSVRLYVKNDIKNQFRFNLDFSN